MSTQLIALGVFCAILPLVLSIRVSTKYGDIEGVKMTSHPNVSTWVEDNIDYFGGDSSKVTIFGDSAGGSSGGLHLLSPLSKGLFHQVIAESGVDLTPWATMPISIGVDFAKELAQKLNCPTGNHDEMVACIRKKKAADIHEHSISSYQFVDVIQWAPVVDKKFLHDTPQNLRKKKDFTKVPLMISFNSNETASILGPWAYSFNLMESVDNGVNSFFFSTFISRLAHARYAFNYSHFLPVSLSCKPETKKEVVSGARAGVTMATFCQLMLIIILVMIQCY